MTRLETALRESFLASLKEPTCSDAIDVRGDCATHPLDAPGNRYIGTYRNYYSDGTIDATRLHKAPAP